MFYINVHQGKQEKQKKNFEFAYKILKIGKYKHKTFQAFTLAIFPVQYRLYRCL